MKKLRLPEIKNKGNFILYICVAAGVILRFFQLGGHPITAAEYASVNFSSGANVFQLLISNAANYNEAPLYHLITYLWTLIFGFSEVSVRVLPAIFGAAGIFIVNKLARSFYSEKVSVIATSLFALNPFQIFYSQVSGGYTMLLICSLLMVYYFMLSVKYNSFVIGPFTFWAIVSLYSGDMSIVLLLILNVILFIRYKEEIRINLWIRSQIFIFLAWLPLLVYFMMGNAANYLHSTEKILVAPLVSLKNMLLGSTIDINFFTVAAVAAASLFLLIGVITCRTIKEKRMTDIMSLSFFMMIFIEWLAALSGKAGYSDSSLLLAGTMLIMIVAIGVSHLSREGMVLFTCVALAFFSISIGNYFTAKRFKSPDYKSAFTQVMHDFKEGDMIIHSGAGSYGPFEFYNALGYKRYFPDRLFGKAREIKGGAKIIENWMAINSFLNEKAGVKIYGDYDRNIITEEELKAVIRPGSRIWHVMEPGVNDPSVRSADISWTKNLYVEKDMSSNGVTLVLLVKK